ncbi:hypothetical protein [Pseudomonas typographi]|uniref:hypothetical protein n=1 Tax=Pseudomonas typographi TaxID=2715964 RepID=UPI0016849BF7|nr:hypothetical protein [Pseudomonas typographi]MBD1587791.1 hypothetical protein [Pseudomonas typographi]
MEIDPTQRDWLDLSDIAQHLHGWETLKHKLRWRLDEALAEAGVGCPADALFVNGVNDVKQGYVISSQPLVEFAAEAVQENHSLTWPGHAEVGVFLRRGSFEAGDRIDTPAFNVGHFFQLVNAVIDRLH